MGELVGSRSGETARARMNKFVCLALFASSALAAPAPQLGQDTSALVDTILSQLDGPIDAAIQAALGGSGTQTKTVETPARSGLNFQGTFTQSPTVTVSTSGNLAFPGGAGKFSSSSSSVGEWSAWTSVGTTGQTVPRPVADAPAVTAQVSSEQAVISSVVKQLEGSISAAVEAALSGSQNTATTAVQPAPAPAKPAKAFSTSSHSTSSHSSSSHSSSSSSSSSSEAQITSQILSVLTPQISEQVALALAQRSSSFSTQSDSVSSSVSSSSSSVSAAQKARLTQQVISALEPAVFSAVSAQFQAQKQAALSSVTVSSAETSSYVSQIVTALQPQIETAVSSALRAQYQSQVESSFSSQSTQTVVSEVLNVLPPRIMTLISDALSAQEAARQQAD